MNESMTDGDATAATAATEAAAITGNSRKRRDCWLGKPRATKATRTTKTIPTNKKHEAASQKSQRVHFPHRRKSRLTFTRSMLRTFARQGKREAKKVKRLLPKSSRTKISPNLEIHTALFRDVKIGTEASAKRLPSGSG